MRTGRPSLWRAPLQAIGMQQQQAKVFLSPLEPQEQAEGDTVTLIGQDGQPHLYEMLTTTSGGDVPAGVIYRPGGTSKDNVLATAAEVKKAIADTSGAIVVFVDASVAPTPGTALWPDTGTGASIGATDCLGTVEFRAYGNEGVPGPAGQVVLEVVDGASFKNLRKCGPGLTLQGQCTTTSALTFSASSSFTLQGDSAGLPCILERLTGATVPMVEVSGSEVVLALLTYAANVENDQAGAVGTFKVDANAAFVWLAAQGLVVEATGPIVTSADNTATFEFIARDPETTMPAASTGWLTGFTGKEILTTDMASPQQQQWDTVWYQATDIYWDPANSSGLASDANPGLTSGLPLSTFAEITRRYGGHSPILPYGQSVTIHQLSGQTAGQDPVYFSPRVSGGGQAILLGTLTANGATFSPASVTAKNRATPQLLVLNTVPGGVVAKNLIHNTTSALTGWAFVDSVAGGNATMSQPLANSTITTTTANPTLTEDNAWANTDTYQAYTLPLCNLKRWRPISSDYSAATQPNAGYVRFVEIADSSGTNGTSVYDLVGESSIVALQACRLDTRMNLVQAGGRVGSCYSIGCDVAGVVFLISGSPNFWGGIARAGLLSNAGSAGVDGDAIVHTSMSVNAAFLIGGAVYTDGAVTLQGGGVYRCTTALWGTGSLTINPGARYWNNSGTTFAASLLLTGAFKLGANTTGTPPSNSGTFTLNGVTQVNVAPGSGHFPANAKIAWSLNTVGGTPGTASPYFSAAQTADQFSVKSPTAGANDVYNWIAFGGSVNLTAANMDTYNGLYDEATGARFCNTS